MNGILPVQGGILSLGACGFRRFLGFQCGWWNWTAGRFLLNSVYGVLLMDYVHDYVPACDWPLEVGGSRAGAVLAQLFGMRAEFRWLAGWRCCCNSRS